jgi:2,4-dienoyl-CoA reductase-like NADH-dependent reductase (Old Yellow Enzyme family)
MKLFEQASIGSNVLKNRIIRSATYEGMCDREGFPTEKYRNHYIELARNDVGGIITGFAYTSKTGRAMQPGQAAIDAASKIPFYREITEGVHRYGSRIFMQVAHAGRQTNREATGEKPVSPSVKRSSYFNQTPRSLGTGEALRLAEEFSDAALRVKESGFDGVQLHAAHGYLIHQFLLPSINNRKDCFGVDPQTRLGTRFLDLIIDCVREKCGSGFPVLVKISGGDDYRHHFSETQLVDLICFLDRKRVSAIEISYGTMDIPLNIFRGRSVPLDAIIRHNPRYRRKHELSRSLWKALISPLLLKKLKPFTPAYNLPYAALAKNFTDIPVISVGGFRDSGQMESALTDLKADFIGLSRPLLCEPDLVRKIAKNRRYIARCVSCNMCAVMCDSPHPTRCCLKANQGGTPWNSSKKLSRS